MNGVFRVGPWLIQPSLNLISHQGTSIRLEPKVMGVLVCLAQHAMEPVSKEELIQAVWPDTFVTDDVLKRCVSELRRVFQDDAREPRLIETIPKRGYRMIVAVEPVAEAPTAPSPESSNGVALSEASHRIKTNSTTAPPWILPRGHWRLVIGTTFLVALAVAAVASLNYFRRDESPIDSIAVMPFASKNAAATGEIADGLTAGLIDSLSQIPQLRVMSRDSVSHYKGQEFDLRKVGRELNVRAVLTGTLTPRGDGFVLDAELVNASDNTHLWGKQYAAKPADVLALQSDLAQTISTRLNPRLAADAKARLANPGTTNPDAYAFYVKGRYAWDRWEPQHMKEALAYFQQAVEMDPAYAQAYGGMADSYTILAFFRSVPLEDGVQKAKAASRKALELNPSLAEGYCGLANVAFVHREWEEASTQALRCVELNPNLPAAHQIYAWTLQHQGKLEEGLAEQKRVLELDPVSFVGNSFLAFSYELLHDFDLAIAVEKKLIERNAKNPDLHDRLATYYEEKGDYEHAAKEEEMALTMRRKVDQAEKLRRAYAKDGSRGFLKAEIALWNDPQQVDDYDPYSVAQNYSLLGDAENAFRWLDNAYEYRDKGDPMQDICCLPVLDNIRSDPRFKAFLIRMGYPPSVSIQLDFRVNNP